MPDFNHLAMMFIYGILGTVLMFGCYKLFDLMTPKIDFARELVDHKNVAVGIVVAALLLGISAIVVAVIVS